MFPPEARSPVIYVPRKSALSWSMPPGPVRAPRLREVLQRKGTLGIAWQQIFRAAVIHVQQPGPQALSGIPTASSLLALIYHMCGVQTQEQVNVEKEKRHKSILEAV